MQLHRLEGGIAERPVRSVTLDAVRERAAAVIALLRLWRRRRRGRLELARLDERTLKDIGLTRADAEFHINKPFWRA